MRVSAILLFFMIIIPVTGDSGDISIIIPPNGTLYHGAFAPVKNHGYETEISEESIRSYENAVGKGIAIGVVSNEWSLNRSFPIHQAEIIRITGAIPYIRLMLRSDTRQYRVEPMFTLSRIRDGYYDADLSAWARDASNFSTPVIVEWGTEVNGNWFAWNGYWNDQEEGVKKFRDAYRHIIDLMNQQGAGNLVWVYHVNWNSVPKNEWNTHASYYPGDEYIDWIGVSLYGALNSESIPTGTFTEHMDITYPILENISVNKPIIISEFGTDFNNHNVDPKTWIEDALAHIVSGRWPRVIGMCWWNSGWPNDRIPEHNTTMRIQESKEISQLFHQYIGGHYNVLENVILHENTFHPSPPGSPIDTTGGFSNSPGTSG